MTRCESYPPCFGTIYFPTAPSNARENMSALRRLFFFCCRSVELGSVHKRHYFFSSEESKLPKLVTPHRIKPTISSYLNQSSILAFDGLSSQ